MDCENGSPGAIEGDRTAIIGVFDGGDRSHIQNFEISRVGPYRLNKANYQCVVPPQGVCVDEYIYETQRVLPKRASGLYLAFQRCCRNNTINNIYDPNTSGATYWVKIPNLNTPNSSAVFKSLPPNYVCVNAPLQVDHSASDPDGDSLVYFLYTPYLGASDDDPRPTTPAKPPYTRLLWSSGYSVTNQMGGDPGLTINRKTGELNVTPNRLGQYVIGIGVKEYRNGKLIGETLRDYQMNVVNCQFDILANFSTKNADPNAKAFVFECQDTVFFEDRSLKAETYFWDFGDPTTTDDTSTEQNPWYIYPGNGDYKVTLKVANSICEDEHNFTVRIRSTRGFNLGPDQIFCGDVSKILDTKADDATSVNWSNGRSGVYIWAVDTGTYIATVKYGQCVYKDTVAIFAYPVNLDLPTDSLFCDDIDMEIDVGIPGLKYQWSTSAADTNQILHVTQVGKYSVEVSNAYCTERDTMRIWRSKIPDIPDAFYCNEFIHNVDIEPEEEASYMWSNNSVDLSTSYTIGGTHWVQQTQRHCVKRDSFTITNVVVHLDLGGDQHFCDTVITELNAGNNRETYLWNTGEMTSTIEAKEVGKYWVRVTDEYGCSRTDTIELSMTISPVLNLGADTTICVNSIIELGPGKKGDISEFLWTTGETTSSISTFEEGTYGLWIKDIYGCENSDSVTVFVDPNALPSDLYIPNAFTPNEDGLNDFFPFSQDVVHSGYFILIYSRWGEKIFDSRESNEMNWDGYYMGDKVPNETFIYYLEYNGCDGNRYSRRGTVNPLY